MAGAAWSLWTRHGEAFSLSGLIVALFAIPIMTLLARRKIAIATELGSRAMRADAVESITCGWLSLVVVIGLVADWLMARLDGKPFASERWFVQPTGHVVKTPVGVG